VDAKNSILLVIDLQERLSPVINDFDKIIENTLQLAKVTTILNVPVLITEQYV
jgi:nicotinamidase-related amidase